MKVTKVIALTGLILILIGLVSLRKDDLTFLINKYLYKENPTATLDNKNPYYRKYDFNYIKNTDNFSPRNKQDILNIYYTVINAGKNNFTFYCPKEYTTCLEDINSLAKSKEEISNINNFVHPYNSFTHIETVYDTLGKISLTIDKNYQQEDINLIEKKLDELMDKLTSKQIPIEQNIKLIHDYIIENAKYDEIRRQYKESTYKSDTAYGPLFEGYAICSGYTDLMALFLDRLNIKNFKVSSNKHVWNAVYLNDNW